MRTPVEAPVNPSEHHLAAVRRSLGWAQEAADRGDFVDAVGWIRVLEAIGEQLPSEYQVKRRVWDDALIRDPARAPGAVL